MRHGYVYFQSHLAGIIQVDSEDFALSLNGKKSNFKLDDFIKFGEYSGLNSKQIENTFYKFIDNKKRMKELINSSFLSEPNKKMYEEMLNDKFSGLVF